jgi:hypothetical protein
MDLQTVLHASIAAFATFLIGGPWYGVLGAHWRHERGAGIAKPGHPARVFPIAYLFSVVACLMLATLLGPDPSVWSGAARGFLVGTCIVAASFGINYQFSNSSWRLLAIDGGYHVLQFTAFGAGLAALR